MKRAQMSMIKRSYFFVFLGFVLFFVFLQSNPFNCQQQAFQQPPIHCIAQNTTQTPLKTTKLPPTECPPPWKVIADDWRVSLIALNKPSNRIGIKPQWSTLPEFLQSCDDFTYTTDEIRNASPLLPSSSSSTYHSIFSPLLSVSPNITTFGRSNQVPLDTGIVLHALKHTDSLPTSSHWDSELPPSALVPCTRWKYSDIRRNLLLEEEHSPRVAILMVTDNPDSELAKQSIAQKQLYVDKLN
jgi:hypothetical protein